MADSNGCSCLAPGEAAQFQATASAEVRLIIVQLVILNQPGRLLAIRAVFPVAGATRG